MKIVVPDAALQQHTAVLGKTGSGKTFAIKGIVESLLAAHKRVGIVDPTGAWWGLRSSRDGKSAGFPILVLGGDHGDLPLPALGGSAVARLLAEQGVNLVADTSQLTVGERTRWFIDFGRELYRLNRAPLHLVIDEAHTFAPQGKVPDPDTGKMLHAMNTIASGGRSRGIRLTMITQRPQKLHKDTLTCADTLIAMRVLAPHDRLAVEDWIKGCGDMAQGKEILNSLASLQRGEGWVWYPEGGFLQRTKFPPIKTFDSSATPMDGATIAAPKGMAEIDLTEINAAMADAVKEAEANDPKLLRAEISRLKIEAAKKPQTAPAQAVPAGPRREDAATINALRKALENAMKFIIEINAKDFIKAAGETLPAAEIEKALAGAVQSAIKLIEQRLAGNRKELDALRSQGERVIASLRALLKEDVTIKLDVRHQEPFSVAPTPSPRAPRPLDGTAGLDKAQRAFLVALAQQGRSLTRNQVAIFAGYSATSRHVDNVLASLRSSGYVLGGGNAIQITEAGHQALGAYEMLPTGHALQEYWMKELDTAASRFLRVICAAYPGTLTRAEVAVKANYSPDSRHVDNTLAQLRSRDLIRGRGTAIKASDELFG